MTRQETQPRRRGRKPHPSVPCVEPGCTRTAKIKGKCRTCYQKHYEADRRRRRGIPARTPRIKRRCSVPLCSGLCSKCHAHEQQKTTRNKAFINRINHRRRLHEYRMREKCAEAQAKSSSGKKIEFDVSFFTIDPHEGLTIRTVDRNEFRPLSTLLDSIDSGRLP